jgi:hypothetical protein
VLLFKRSLHRIGDEHIITQYGRCFGFNNPSLILNNTALLDGKAVTPTLGEDSELIMHLRIDEEQYIRAPTVLQTSGAKIAILPFNNPPNIMDEGYNVVPGMETKFELKAVGLIVACLKLL